MKDLLKRITFNKDILCGKPLIRGMRISVEMILELLVNGATEQEILEDYPEKDVRKRKWFSAEEASQKVTIPEIPGMIDSLQAKVK